MRVFCLDISSDIERKQVFLAGLCFGLMERGRRLKGWGLSLTDLCGLAPLWRSLIIRFSFFSAKTCLWVTMPFLPITGCCGSGIKLWFQAQAWRAGDCRGKTCLFDKQCSLKPCLWLFWVLRVGPCKQVILPPASPPSALPHFLSSLHPLSSLHLPSLPIPFSPSFLWFLPPSSFPPLSLMAPEMHPNWSDCGQLPSSLTIHVLEHFNTKELPPLTAKQKVGWAGVGVFDGDRAWGLLLRKALVKVGSLGARC